MAVKAFEEVGIFIVPHLLGNWAWDFFGRMGFASYDLQGDAEDLFQPGMSWVPIQLPLRIRVRIGPPHPLQVV